jgi:hypothetical protein
MMDDKSLEKKIDRIERQMDLYAGGLFLFLAYIVQDLFLTVAGALLGWALFVVVLINMFDLDDRIREWYGATGVND